MLQGTLMRAKHERHAGHKAVYRLGDIVEAMRTRRVITLEGETGLINGISVEDGSGKSWLVKMCQGTSYRTLWIKTS
jgi:hypothetical protein